MTPKFTARELAVARATKNSPIFDFIQHEMKRGNTSAVVKNHEGTEIPYWSLFHHGYRNVEQIKRSGKYSVTIKEITK